MALKNVYILFTTIESHIDGVMQQVFTKEPKKNHNYAVAYREGGGDLGGLNPQKFRRPSKIVPNSSRLRKLLKIVEFRKPTPQDAEKRQ